MIGWGSLALCAMIGIAYTVGIIPLVFEYKIAHFFRKFKDEFSKSFSGGFLVLFSVGIISMVYGIFRMVSSFYISRHVARTYGPTGFIKLIIPSTVTTLITGIVFSIATLCAFYFLYSSTNYFGSKDFTNNRKNRIKKFFTNLFKPLSKYKIFIITIVCSVLIVSVITEIMKSQTFEIVRYMNVASISIGCIISLMILLTKYYLKTFFGKNEDRFSKLLSRGFNILFMVGICEIIYGAVEKVVEFYLFKILPTLSVEEFYLVVNARAYVYFIFSLVFSLLTLYGIYVIYSSKRFFKEENIVDTNP
ncbi:MAG: hypothetical protein COS08_08055 [Euryarchaeota archaeon CG01_land_8_20_14_3_00_38_12]|nr:MAG: hypothetical protein COS08_08055 [Euryarchaeota archaeon CG01_land_8_20_14_3_00_38_12]